MMLRVEKIERLGLLERAAHQLADDDDRVQITISGNAGRFDKLKLSFIFEAGSTDSEMLAGIKQALPEALRAIADEMEK